MRGVYLFAWIWIRMLIMIAPQPRTIEISNYYRRPMTRDYKIGNDFEWAFLTVPLGFVDDEYQKDHSLWANFMTQYSQFISRSEAYDTRITKSYYEGKEQELCKAYLSDPFFKSNRIAFEPPTNNKNQCRFELKAVNFHYFSRITDYIKVIGCPVWTGQENRESRLYFHEFHYTWRHMERAFRGYFVFANINKDANKPGRQYLELLMYTSRNKKPLPDIDNDPESEEAEFRDTRNRKILNLPNLKLYIEVPLFARSDKRQLLALQRDMTRLHLFGEEAELFLLSRIYGFFDQIHPYWQKKTLILMLNRMGKGYELNRIAMEIARKSDTKITCINYINYNEMLHIHRNISVNEDLPSSEFKWTTKLVRFPMTEFLPHGQKYELLECPVKHKEYAKVYILPVFYRAAEKPPKVFSFVEDDKSPGELLPLLYSSVDQTKFVLPDLIDLSEPLPEEWLS